MNGIFRAVNAAVLDGKVTVAEAGIFYAKAEKWADTKIALQWAEALARQLTKEDRATIKTIISAVMV